MINFRFHLASLIAVFLALALGVVMGSTVIDRAIVDGLRDRIDRVSRNADAQRSDNARLQRQLDRQQLYTAQTAAWAVTGRLTDVPVVVIAMRGVDDDAVKRVVQTTQEAGAKLPAVLWLEPRWALGSGKGADARALAAALGVQPAGDRALRAAGWRAIAARIAGAGMADPSGDVLTGLQDAGFVTFSAASGDGAPPPLATWPGPGSRVLLVAGGTSGLAARGIPAEIARALVDARIPTVAGEVFDDRDNGPARGATLASILGDDTLKRSVSTVDDLDLTEGAVAAVLALSDLGRNVVGHYGYGSGAERAVPEWASP